MKQVASSASRESIEEEALELDSVQMEEGKTIRKVICPGRLINIVLSGEDDES